MSMAEINFCLQIGERRRLSLAETYLADLVQLIAGSIHHHCVVLNLKVSEGQCYFRAMVGRVSFLKFLLLFRAVHLLPTRQGPLLVERTLDPSFLPASQSKIKKESSFYAAIRWVGGISEISAALGRADFISSRLSKSQAFAFSMSIWKPGRLFARGNEKDPQEIVIPAWFENRAGRFEKKKILLVEENRVNQLLTSTFLCKWGYEIQIAGNGQEAVEKARAQVFDLILMDIIMPGTNGYVAGGIIRSLSLHYSQIPILAFTASAVEEVEAEDDELIFTDIIMKPFKPEILYNNVHKHLNAAQEEAGLNPLQAKIDRIARGDEAFKKQLIHLYLKSFRELLLELNTGKMLEIDYLRHVRHKHKATFEMLGLSAFAGQLLQMQENLSKRTTGTVCLKEINLLGEEIIHQLETIN